MKNIWNKNIALKIAKKLGIKKINNLQWKIIYFIRAYYAYFNKLPTYRMIINYISQNSHLIKITTELFYNLFPKGLGNKCFNIAGIKNAKRCI